MTAPGPLPAPSLVFTDVEIGGQTGLRVEVADGIVTYVGPPAARHPASRRDRVSPVTEVEGRGGLLLPGLHDHHLHLLALAAHDRSAPCGPPSVLDRRQLGAILRTEAATRRPGEWVRGVGHDERVTGPIDALVLDELLGPLCDRPVRVQDRSGHLWVLNSSGLATARRSVDLSVFGPEGDRGRLFGADAALRIAWAGDEWPPLDPVGAALARVGCTGVTDASVSTGPDETAFIAAAQADGALPQRVCALGKEVTASSEPCFVRGPVKIVLSDANLPELDELVTALGATNGRGAALHCVSREALVLCAVALARAGGGPHRVEHAGVAPPDIVSLLAALPVTVVTQPAFVDAHGDRYLSEVAADDRPWLYRLAGWDAAGVPLAGSTDGPFGSLDPWAGMRAAVHRTTAGGAPLGRDEALSPERALDLFLGPLEAPGGPPRRVVPGQPADLCLLQASWAEAREVLDAELVRATFCSGEVVFGG